MYKKTYSLIPLFISLITLLYFYNIGITDFPFLLFAFLNTLICNCIMFSNANRPFTLYKMIMLFIYVFFILANAIQYYNHTNTLTFPNIFNSSDYIGFQIMLFLIILITQITYSEVAKIELNKIKHQSYNIPIIRVNYFSLVVAAIFSTFITLCYMDFNPYRLFFRGLTDEYLLNDSSLEVNSSIYLIFDKIIRPIPFAVTTILFLFKSPSIYKFIGLLCMLIVLCPTGLSRNAVAMYWLPIFILWGGNRLRHNIFMWIIWCGLFFIFPFLNIFRRWDGNFEFKWSMDFLDNINFDASQLFMAVIKYDWITFGYQLLGPFTFFIPRSIWSSKPLGSGHQFTTLYHASHTNVSMPYWAEGFVNFGFWGIILFSIILAYVCAKLDSLYWYKWKDKFNKETGIYLIFIGSSIFILRGDLLSSTAYCVGTILCFIFTISLCSKVLRKY